MKRPLVAIVSCYVIGLLIAGIFQPPLAALFAIAFAVLVPALVLEKLRPWLIWPLLALTGWTNLASRTAVLSPNDLRAWLSNTTASVKVRGTLSETPHLKIVEHGEQETWRTAAQVRVSELRQGENWRAASGKIIVTTPAVMASNFFAGQPVEIAGVIERPPTPLAEGLFDYRDYLQTRGIFYQLKTGSPNDWQLGPSPLTRLPLTDRFLNWSKQTLALGLPGEDEPLRLLWTMTLGWRTALTPDISEPFLRAGTMHLFAIDGLRIALISGMLVALLRLLQVARAWCGIVAIPAIWFYTAATGWEPSAIRASVMMTIIIGGWALKRPSNLINSLAAAAFVILLWEPRQFFEASFQLSFFVVLVIALMLPPLNEMIDRLLQHDPLLPDELLPRWRRALTATLRMLGRYCALSFAAWVGSIPLAAKYFHLFSPVSPPANIVAVPLGTLALMSNLGSLVCGMWFPWVTGLFNHSAWFFMSAMMEVSELSTKIPGAFFYVPAPSWLDMGIYYAALVGALSGWRWWSLPISVGRASPRAGSSVASPHQTVPQPDGGWFVQRWRWWFWAALVFLSIFYAWRWQTTRSEITLTVLPLNGGHAVWVDAPGRKNDWLVNCGDANAVEFTLKPFLRAQGVNHLSRLALTYGSARNNGGAELLNELFGIGELVTSPVPFRSGAYRNVVAKFNRPPTQHTVIQRGDHAGCWQVLHPGAGENFTHADDAALVLFGNFHGARVLLLSDLGRSGQSALLARPNDLRADIVVAGLPDGGEPLCEALLDAVQPKIIAVADAEFPASRRASAGLRERLGQRKILVIYTRAAGAVTLAARSGGWELRTMAGQKLTSR
jgi:competence protein ComEC